MPVTNPHARALDDLFRYYTRELTGEEEAAMEDHWAACPDCADAASEVASLVAGVTDLVACGFGLWAISPDLLQRFRDRGLRIHEARTGPGGALAIPDTTGVDLLIGRLSGEFAGLHEVDVSFDTVDGVLLEQGVPVHSGLEVIIACVLHLRAPSGTKIRSTCTIKAEDVVLGEYHLAIDVS